MKAVILAAGRGSRLQELTADVPKVLVEVNGKPFLWYVIETLKKVGVIELGIVVGYKKEKVQAFLAENRISATMIEQKEQRGTGDAVAAAREFVGEDEFIVFHGDGLMSENDLKKFVVKDGKNYAGAITVDDPSHFGIFVVENDMLVEVKEKPTEDVGNLASASLYKFTPQLFKYLDQVTKSPRGEIELTDAVTMLAKEGIRVITFADFWLHLSTPEDVQRIAFFLKEYWD